MAQLNSIGQIIDTGVPLESPAHQLNESPAHVKSAVPSLPAASAISFLIGWVGCWSTVWSNTLSLGGPPALGSTSITIDYFGSPPPGSAGGTIAVGVGVGMTVTDAYGTFAPSTTVTSVTGLVIGLSLPTIGTSGGIGPVGFSYSGLANCMFPTSWDAYILLLPGDDDAAFVNYDPAADGELLTLFAGGAGGTDAGTLDGDGYEFFNAPSDTWWTVDFTSGTAYGWGHDATPSLFGRIYPATTDFGGTGEIDGPVNSYLFQYGAAVLITSTQTFSPANYTGNLSTIGGTSGGSFPGVNSDSSVAIQLGGITVDFDPGSGFSCATSGVITGNTGSEADGWSCDFSYDFLYPFNIIITMSNMGYDATFGKSNSYGEPARTGINLEIGP